MNIKTRLSFQFTLIVTGILLIFSILTYYFSSTSQIDKFREGLLDNAKNSAILLINVAEVDSALLKKIHQATISWEKQEIAITDSANHIIYSDSIHFLSDDVIRTHSRIPENHFFSIAKKDGVCYKHHFKNKIYNVFVMAIDSDRTENLSELRGILTWCVLFNICLSVILSYLFSKKAIQPITRIINSVKDINSARLSDRLDEGKRKDEIDQLAMTFNEMLSNLELAFNNQKDFVSNASHELRTPLTVMIGETDYLLSREHRNEEYIEHLIKISNDLKQLNILLNSLLELAQINKDNIIQISKVRIDELVFNAIQQTKSKFQDRRIVTKIEYTENANDFQIDGNPGILTIAFKNVIDNACKFSNGDITIGIYIVDKVINVNISDKGIGIPASELSDIFRPFKRASNVKYKSGFGIGLYLVDKIVKLHNARIEVSSVEGEGTRFEILFNKCVD